MSNIIFEIYNEDWYFEYACFNLHFFREILLSGIKIIIKQRNSDYNGSISLNFDFYKENISLLHKLLENNIKINIDVDYQIFNNLLITYFFLFIKSLIFIYLKLNF